MAINKDKLFDQKLAAVNKFSFDSDVANVFTDMISRSVPGYQQILEMLPTLVKYTNFTKGNYYDLGCSLGAGMIALAEGLQNKHAMHYWY